MKFNYVFFLFISDPGLQVDYNEKCDAWIFFNSLKNSTFLHIFVHWFSLKKKNSPKNFKLVFIYRSNSNHTKQKKLVNCVVMRTEKKNTFVKPQNKINEIKMVLDKT